MINALQYALMSLLMFCRLSQQLKLTAQTRHMLLLLNFRWQATKNFYLLSGMTIHPQLGTNTIEEHITWRNIVEHIIK